MAEADKKNEKSAAPEGEGFQAPKLVGKNPLMLALMLVQIVLMGVIAYSQWTNHQKMAQEQTIKDVVKAEMQAAMDAQEEAKKDPTKVKEIDGISFPLEPITANLAQGDGPRRFLRFNAVLKFSKDSSEEEFKARQAQIRDSIITILNAKRPQDLLSIEGKNYLKEEIKSAINSFLVDGSVIDVFYVGFQIN